VLADQAWFALEQANTPPVFFRHADALVRIDEEPDGTALIRPLTQDRLRFYLARVASWEKPIKGGVRLIAPPLDVVRDMLARPDPPLPPLKHLTYAPFITPSGVLHTSPGYCAECQLYYSAPRALRIPAVPPNPTRTEIDAAKALILESLEDFPFVGAADSAHAVSLALLPFVEQLVDGAIPAHAIDKPVPGAGGGLLADILLFPSLGRPPAKMTVPGDEAEMRRVIIGKLRQGYPVIEIDNVQHPLTSAALASALTEAFVEDRLVRDSRVVRVAARRIWVVVGNNLVLSDEIQRRTIMIRLDPGVERPELRSGFRHPLLRQWVLSRRADLVHALLTLIQAWIAEGRPLGTVTIGSFEGWAQVIGGILDVAGISAFLTNRDAMYRTADPREVAWKALVQLWWSQVGNREVGVSDLWTMLTSHAPDILIELDLGDRTDAGRKTQLGLRLNAHRDRVWNRLRLTLAGSSHGANQWRLDPV
jgi:hypothetical protein